LRKVTFRYPDASRPAIRQLELDIPAGSFVAITGPVGCGKSSLLRAISSLYPLESGEILLNGEPGQCLSPAERAGRIGYLHQDPYLFSGPIQENISFGGQELTQLKRIDEAIHVANLDADIQAFPSGLNTEVGEMGMKVSGGQRQRIAFARSLAGPTGYPGLLLLDDPFSAVDLDTEAQLIASLRQAFGPEAPPDKQATILMTSHRLAAFPQADLVIVLNDGKVCESGTHAQLLARGGLYERIYHTQGQIARPKAQPHGLHIPDLYRGEA
jgi:ABC-type bacteriocin/lantibiotic exporter with double-glycine peptidase domain